jgi:hypothetical protein
MLLKNNSQCPKCSGALRIRFDMTLICPDCKARFEPYDEGMADTELRYREVKNGQ